MIKIAPIQLDFVENIYCMGDLLIIFLTIL